MKRMDDGERVLRYLLQTGRKALTGPQRRRALKKRRRIAKHGITVGATIRRKRRRR